MATLGWMGNSDREGPEESEMDEDVEVPGGLKHGLSGSYSKRLPEGRLLSSKALELPRITPGADPFHAGRVGTGSERTCNGCLEASRTEI